ncbi:MAG: LPP20 family lipoprotein, partial [Fibrobacter sp.]|nr:LPP20 family lipoprotein [Fibrobacter sp.]
MRSLLLLIPAVTVLVACTGTGSQSIRTEMEQTGCSPTALRGYGFAANGTDAQNEAYSQIATQIKSSVEFSSKSSKQMTVKNGDENVESSYLIENATMASISNAENVQVVYSKSGPEGVGVVACMERAAAAQPFVRMYETARDSFNMEVGAASSEKHPLKFATAVKNAMRLYNQMVQSREVVENLEQGVKFAGDLPAAKDANDKLVEFFQQFKKDYSVTIAEDSSTLDASVSGLLRETLMNMNKFDG